MSNIYIRKMDQVGIKDVGEVGGKNASLGEMLGNKIPVPDGFVVLSTTFDRFIEETDINIEIDSELKKVNKNDVK